MTAFVALLRGINVGGKNRLPMAGLRALLTSLACENVSTCLQSGNAVFRHRLAAATLAQKIALALEAEFGLVISVLVLSAKDYQAVIAAQPFADAEPNTVHTWFLREPAIRADTTRIAQLAADSEVFELTDAAFYLHAPDGIGRSKLANSVERCLKVDASARNWRTMGKISELLAALD